MLKKVLIVFLLVILRLVKSCDQFCINCDFNNACQSCKPPFTLVKDGIKNYCSYKNCEIGEWFQPSINSCLLDCPLGQIRSEKTGICLPIADCPTSFKIGSIFHSLGVIKGILSFEETILATIGKNDKQILLWNMKNGELLQALEEHKSPVVQITLDQTKDRFTSISNTGEIIIWSFKFGEFEPSNQGTFLTPTNTPLTFNQIYYFNSSLKEILGLNGGGSFYLCGIEPPFICSQFYNSNGYITNILLSSENQNTIYSYSQKALAKWDRNSKTVLSSKVLTNSLASVAFLSCTENPIILLIDAVTLVMSVFDTASSSPIASYNIPTAIHTYPPKDSKIMLAEKFFLSYSIQELILVDYSTGKANVNVKKFLQFTVPLKNIFFAAQYLILVTPDQMIGFLKNDYTLSTKKFESLCVKLSMQDVGSTILVSKDQKQIYVLEQHLTTCYIPYLETGINLDFKTNKLNYSPNIINFATVDYESMHFSSVKGIMMDPRYNILFSFGSDEGTIIFSRVVTSGQMNFTSTFWKVPPPSIGSIIMECKIMNLTLSSIICLYKSGEVYLWNYMTRTKIKYSEIPQISYNQMFVSQSQDKLVLAYTNSKLEPSKMTRFSISTGIKEQSITASYYLSIKYEDIGINSGSIFVLCQDTTTTTKIYSVSLLNFNSKAIANGLSVTQYGQTFYPNQFNYYPNDDILVVLILFAGYDRYTRVLQASTLLISVTCTDAMSGYNCKYGMYKNPFVIYNPFYKTNCIVYPDAPNSLNSEVCSQYDLSTDYRNVWLTIDEGVPQIVYYGFESDYPSNWRTLLSIHTSTTGKQSLQYTQFNRDLSYNILKQQIIDSTDFSSTAAFYDKYSILFYGSEKGIISGHPIENQDMIDEVIPTGYGTAGSVTNFDTTFYIEEENVGFVIMGSPTKLFVAFNYLEFTSFAVSRSTCTTDPTNHRIIPLKGFNKILTYDDLGACPMMLYGYKNSNYDYYQPAPIFINLPANTVKVFCVQILNNDYFVCNFYSYSKTKNLSVLSSITGAVIKTVELKYNGVVSAVPPIIYYSPSQNYIAMIDNTYYLNIFDFYTILSTCVAPALCMQLKSINLKTYVNYGGGSQLSLGIVELNQPIFLYRFNAKSLYVKNKQKFQKRQIFFNLKINQSINLKTEEHKLIYVDSSTIYSQYIIDNIIVLIFNYPMTGFAILNLETLLIQKITFSQAFGDIKMSQENKCMVFYQVSANSVLLNAYSTITGVITSEISISSLQIPSNQIVQQKFFFLNLFLLFFHLQKSIVVGRDDSFFISQPFTTLQGGIIFSFKNGKLTNSYYEIDFGVKALMTSLYTYQRVLPYSFTGTQMSLQSLLQVSLFDTPVPSVRRELRSNMKTLGFANIITKQSFLLDQFLVLWKLYPNSSSELYYDLRKFLPDSDQVIEACLLNDNKTIILMNSTHLVSYDYTNIVLNYITLPFLPNRLLCLNQVFKTSFFVTSYLKTQISKFQLISGTSNFNPTPSIIATTDHYVYSIFYFPDYDHYFISQEGTNLNQLFFFIFYHIFKDGQLKVYQNSDDSLLKTLNDNTKFVEGAIFDARNSLVTTFAADGKIICYNYTNTPSFSLVIFKTLTVLHSYKIRDFQFTPISALIAQERIVIRTHDFISVYYYDYASFNYFGSVFIPYAEGGNFAVFPDYDILLSYCYFQINFFQFSSLQKLHIYRNPLSKDMIMNIELIDSELFLLEHNNRIQLWRLQTTPIADFSLIFELNEVYYSFFQYRKQILGIYQQSAFTNIAFPESYIQKNIYVKTKQADGSQVIVDFNFTGYNFNTGFFKFDKTLFSDFLPKIIPSKNYIESCISYSQIDSEIIKIQSDFDLYLKDFLNSNTLITQLVYQVRVSKISSEIFFPLSALSYANANSVSSSALDWKYIGISIDKQIALTSDFFSRYMIEEFYLKSFTLNLTLLQNVYSSFASNVKSIMLTNIQIDDKVLNSSITADSVDRFIINDMVIENTIIIDSPLFRIKNSNLIKINKLKISNVEFHNYFLPQQTPTPLFQFYNCKMIIIQDLIIQNSLFIAQLNPDSNPSKITQFNSIFQTLFSGDIRITNVQLSNNNFQVVGQNPLNLDELSFLTEESFYYFFMFDIRGTYNITISDVTAENTSNISLVFANSNFFDPNLKNEISVQNTVFYLNRTSQKSIKSKLSLILVQNLDQYISADCNFENIQSSGIRQGAVLYSNQTKQLQISNSIFLNVSSNSSAGALSVNYAFELLLTGSNFTANQAFQDGGAVYLNQISNFSSESNVFSSCLSQTGNGGALFLDEIYDQIDFKNQIFLSNSANQDGGAIYFSRIDQLGIEGSSFTNNTALGSFGGGGLFAFKVSKLFIIQSSNFNQNKALNGNGGSIFNLNSTCQSKLFHNTFNNNYALGSGGAYRSLFNGGEFYLENMIFYNNSANRNGGGASIEDCSFEKVSTHIKSNNINFNSNVADLSGGGLFLSGCDMQMDYNITSGNLILQSSFSNNTASIGGAIRYQNVKSLFINQQKSPINDPSSVNINLPYELVNNSATLFGSNIGSYAVSFTLKKPIRDNNNNNDNATDLNSASDNLTSDISQSNASLSDMNQDTSIQSGQILDYIIVLVDEENRTVSLDYQKITKPTTNRILQTNTSAINIQNDLLEEIEAYYLEVSSVDSYLQGQTIFGISDYNSTQGGFQIQQLRIVGIPNQKSTINMASNAIQIPFSDVTIQQLFDFQLEFPNCQRGEIFKPMTFKNTTLMECYACPDGKYSLKDPSVMPEFCEVCPLSAKLCQGDQIVIKNDYWLDPYSVLQPLIIFCQNLPSNCVGENPVSIINNKTNQKITHYCMEGHIGPLCQTCDLTGDYWNQRYSRSGKYGCYACDQIAGNSIILIATMIGATIQLLISIQSAIGKNKTIATTMYLRKTGMAFIMVSGESDQSSIYLKFLLSYIQILTAVKSMQVAIPRGFQVAQETFGNPVESSIYSIDCFLYSLGRQTHFPIVYQRIIFGLSLPIVYSIGSLLLFYVLYQVTKATGKLYESLICALVFLILQLQPSVISALISAISCRKIGSRSYIVSDVTYECYSDIHLFFSFFLLYPSLIVWVFVLPLLIFKVLHSNRFNLRKIFVLFQYGYLYSQYKETYYYWELVKLFIQFLLGFAINFLGSQNKIKAIVLTLILLAYLTFSMKKNPYMNRFQGQIDLYSSIISIASLLFALGLYQNDDQSQVLAIFIIFAFINISFITYLIFLIIFSKPPIQKLIYLLQLKSKKKMPRLFQNLRIIEDPFRPILLWQILYQSTIQRLQQAKNLQDHKKQSADSQTLFSPQLNDQLKLTEVNAIDYDYDFNLPSPNLIAGQSIQNQPMAKILGKKFYAFSIIIHFLPNSFQEKTEQVQVQTKRKRTKIN